MEPEFLTLKKKVAVVLTVSPSWEHLALFEGMSGGSCY